MSFTLYCASVPVFRRFLGRLDAWLDTAAAHAGCHGLPAEELLQSRLAPGMLPLAVQVEVAANFALRASYPLAGLAVPHSADFAPSFAGLHERLRDVDARLAALDAAAFAGAEERRVEERAGKALVALDAATFLAQYALPNFFFHLGMAYAILRQRGVALGKADFDGFHVY